jgi:predicted DNA binding CopG/RHH family protein
LFSARPEGFEMHWSKKIMVSARVDPVILRALQKRAAQEGVKLQTALEHALLLYIDEARPLDRSACER